MEIKQLQEKAKQNSSNLKITSSSPLQKGLKDIQGLITGIAMPLSKVNITSSHNRRWQSTGLALAGNCR